MAKRRGRPKKTEAQKLSDALERARPNDRIMERRQLFSFVQLPPDKRQDGRNGEIDSEVCDGIGQLCALGFLDGHGHDPIELRDKGRFWGGHYVKLMKGLASRTAPYERKDRSQPTGALTAADLLFDKMDANLPRYERSVLLSLLVDPEIGHKDIVPWAQVLIDDELFSRGRFRSGVMYVGYVTEDDRARLAAAIRGLNILVDGSLAPRWERAA